MSRVLVVHPPVSIARDFIDYPYFADLGAVQLAAVIADARLVNAFALRGSTLSWRADGRAHLGAPVDEVLAAALTDSCEAAVVAYTPFHRPPARCDVLGELLAGLRAARPAVPIVLADCYQSGQHYVEAEGAAVLASYPEVDAWVKYEAEVTVPRLLAPGAPRPHGVVRGVEPALDDLPFPAWERVDLAAHDRFLERVVANLGRGPWAFPVDGRTLPLVTSRGCPYTCVHCSSNPGRVGSAPKTQRRYAQARLRAYLRALVRDHGATRLAALDELINVNERHFDAFLDEITALDTRFDCPNGMRADYLEPRHLDKMRGRVATVSVSAESGVQRVVTEVVKKRLDLACIVAAAEHAHAAGVPLMIHYMIGLPGESAAEINGTLAFALDLHERFGAWPAVQYATPLPGTDLAHGRSLPVVDDWGPRFQSVPGVPELAVFRGAFEARMAAAARPARLVINPTYGCNNRCAFCAVVGDRPVPADAARRRELLAVHRSRGAVDVEVDGGEPTLDPDLPVLLRYARHLGYQRVAVTTNGRMCSYPEYARRLATSGATTIRVSLHGADAATHGREVGVAEAFEQTVQGVRQLVELAPAGVVELNVTVTRGNLDQLDAIAGLAWQLGVRALNLLAITPFGRATPDLAPSPAATARAARAVIDAWKDRLRVRVHNLPFCFLPGYEEHVAGDPPASVVVNGEDVDLAGYLAARRRREPVCAGCPHALRCAGFWDLEAPPEPRWRA